MKKILIFSLLCLMMASCVSSNSSKSNIKGRTDRSASEVKEMTLSDNEVQAENALESYLQRTPGVTVLGSGQNARVQVRGVNSFSGNTQPLFIVNGTDVGNSYSSAASMLRGMKIKSVRVLKNADASIYGVRGAGGVIIVKAE